MSYNEMISLIRKISLLYWGDALHGLWSSGQTDRH